MAKWITGAALLVALIGAWYFLPVRDWAEAFQGWIEGLGAWGFLVFAGVYVLATVLLLPVSILSIAAGLAFGLPAGFAVVVISATIGATLAFLISRHLAHEAVESFVAKHPKLNAVKAAVSEGAWKIVILLRLSHVVPFNVQNYLYGITDVSLKHYALATFVGIMPGTLLYVYLGSVGQGESGPLEWGFFAAGLLATLVLVVFVTFKAKSKLKEHGLADGTGDKKKTVKRRSN